MLPAGLRSRVGHDLLDHLRQTTRFVLDDRGVLFDVFAILDDSGAEVVRSGLNDGQGSPKLVEIPAANSIWSLPRRRARLLEITMATALTPRTTSTPKLIARFRLRIP